MRWVSHLVVGSLALVGAPGAAARLQAPAPEWSHITTADGLPEGEVRAVLGSSAGEMWFAVGGLAAFDGAAWRYVTVDDGLVANDIADLAELGDAIWAVGRNGYSVRREGAWQGYGEVGGRTTGVIFSVTEAPGGAVWLGASGFAARLDAEGWRHVDVADGLPHAVVHQALTDRRGETWFACRRGLARLAGDEADELEVLHPEVNFRSILEDEAGRVWFGTSAGVLVYDGATWAWRLEGRTALPKAVDDDGRVWATTEGDGVFVLDETGSRHVTTADGLLSDVVFDVAIGTDGAVWFATDGGVSRWSAPGMP